MSSPEAGPAAPLVFVDGFNLALAEGTGVASYSRALIQAQRSLGYRVGGLYGTPAPAVRDPLLREVLFFDNGRPMPAWTWPIRHLRHLVTAPFADVAERVPRSGRVIGRPPFTEAEDFDEVWNARDLFHYARLHFTLSGSLRRVRIAPSPAIMHWTYPLPISVPGARNVTTIHDLVPLLLPHATLDDKARHLRLLRRLAQHADHIVTVSETSRRDIVSLLGVPEGRVTNTYQAVDIPVPVRTLPIEDARAEVATGFGLSPGAYYLFVGAIEPKKNLARLIRAHRASGVAAPLVLVGPRGWQMDAELKALLPSEPANTAVAPPRRVVQLGHVPRAALIALIRCARAVLLPSLYEGFGLPAVEAMQLGTPVITTATGAMPEIAGEAALLVDPYDVRAIATAIRALDADAALRARLMAAGLAQARRFTAERYAERIGALYAQLGVVPPKPDGALP